MRILNVAEKPAMAKQIASCLASHYSTTDGRNKYCKNFCFDYNLNGQSVQMVMTSVLGHVQELDFPPEFSNWQLTPPASLLSPASTPVVKSTPEANRGIVRNLEEQARSADWLVIWTDCDREGEHIGSEIVQICQRVNHRLQVYRARYSAVTQSELRRAMAQLQRLDQKQVAAVNVRSELDLRTGACFTRFQTLKLQQAFPTLQKEVISYGSCQFPTLGFVVEQYFKVTRFTPEPFWYLDLQVEQEGICNSFTWKRGHLHDQLITLICYERCLQDPRVRITSVIEKPCTRYKPLPLRTVEFQKAASKFLKMTSEVLMTVAERLYNRGYISYPRTETDVFEFSAEELKGLVRKQANDPNFGHYANRLLEGEFSYPRKGKNNDKAHPPIHPTSPGTNLAGADAAVFNFIARRFLACCSLNAEGRETVVQAAVGREEFECRGVRVVARNYLEVYPFDKWNEGEVAPFRTGQVVSFKSLLMQQGSTSPPQLLTEADLINCMDKNGIGTDATIHEHIHKLLLRSYALKIHNSRHFLPTRLGTALVVAYDALGLDVSLTQPKLRAALEESLSRICAGEVQATGVLEQLMGEFRGVFGQMEREFEGRMMARFREYLGDGSGGGRPFDPMPLPAGNNGNSNDDDGSHDNGDENSAPRGNSSTNGKRKPRRKTATTTRSNSNSNSASTTTTAATTRTYNKRAHTTTTTTTTTTNCNCGNAAVQKTVSKAGPNRGRPFWTCSERPGCGFFSWADDDESAGGLSHSGSGSRAKSVPRIESTAAAAATGSLQQQQQQRECACGLLMIRGDYKRGPNAGRAFLKCPRIVGKCGAFEFIDGSGGDGSSNGRGGDFISPAAKRTRTVTAAIRSRSSANSTCFKCNEPGHWANACPNK